MVIESRKLKSMFNGMPYEVSVKNISVNGVKRGCSGFLTTTDTGKICYITTEPACDGGLFGNPDKAVMMRTAKSLKDYTGGYNRWLPISDIVEMANNLTA